MRLGTARPGRLALLICFAVAIAIAAPRVVAAEDRWRDPFPGVRYLHRTTSRPLEIYALFVDLRAPGIAFTVNRWEDRNIATDTFASRHGVSAAINGGLCGEGGDVCRSLQRGRYETWPDTRDTPIHGNVVFGAESRIDIIPIEPVMEAEDWMSGILSSKPMVVVDGAVTTEILPEWGLDDHICSTSYRNPRTSIGLSEDRNTLIMVVVDGRSSASAGLFCPELGELMVRLGAHWALNLDGGGSSTMWIRGRGIVNVPSDPGNVPRTVANHLGLFALGAKFKAELVAIDAPASLAPGERGQITITYRNTGTDTWEPDQVGLRTTLERDHESVLATSDWETPGRPVHVEATTAPGDVGAFRFVVQAPEGSSECAVAEHFGLLLERYGPFRDVATWFGPADDVAAVEIPIAGCGAPPDAGAAPIDAGIVTTMSEPAADAGGGCRAAPARDPSRPALALLALAACAWSARRRRLK